MFSDVADGTGQIKMFANGSICPNGEVITSSFPRVQDTIEQENVVPSDNTKNGFSKSIDGFRKSSCETENLFVDDVTTDRNDVATTNAKCSQIVTLITAASCFFIFTFQGSAFGAFYVILTQYFNVSKLTAGWVGSIQFGMANVGSKWTK